MSYHEEIVDFPFLTPEEFNLACHYLDQKYISATLGNERRAFRLRIQYSMITGASFLAIAQPIDVSKNDLSLVLDLDALGWGDGPSTLSSTMDVDAEDNDTEALRPSSAKGVTFGSHDELPGYAKQAQQPYVVYEIHLHPTYRTPVLWFSLHDLPPLDSALDIESVYRHLIPDQFKAHLRTVGVMGGISAGNNPVTDLPAFFVHPCNTKEAMEPFQCSLKDYLGIWLGIVGPCMGLWVPIAMAQVQC